MDLLSPQKELKPRVIMPRFIVVFSKFLYFISTSLVIRFAARLFITPFHFPVSIRESTMAKGAQKKSVFIGKINKEIHVLSYGYSKRKVLFVHGWSGRPTQFFAFADTLLEHGFMVTSFDGPAHGKSSGKTTHLIEFLITIEKINELFGPFEAAIGHSFGGICLYNAVSDFLKIKTLVTIGTGDKISDILKQFLRNLGLKETMHLSLQQFLEKNGK